MSATAQGSAQNLDGLRSSFRELLIQNPNYFGNLPGSKLQVVQKLTAHTQYEQLTCLGFNPQSNFLEATIALKLPTGYGGKLCSAGTTEYVRFFLDYGAGWEDVGLAGVRVHDIPTENDCAGAATKPLLYVASLRIKPRTKCCKDPVVPKARAILSWEQVPPAGDPTWNQTWGNTLECHVQIKPHPWNILCLLELFSKGFGKELKIPPFLEPVKLHPLPLPDPPPFTLAELVHEYQGKTEAGKGAGAALAVEAHRFGFADLHPVLNSQFAFDGQVLSAKEGVWKAAGLDWPGALAALSKTKADVSYEELECLGIDDTLPERLVATFRVKRGFGYSGELCRAGSQEYVAFWADWENKCKWTYLGTVAVNVHDLAANLPAGGVCYSAILPVDLAYHRQPCEKPKVGRVRAVLSWAAPPSTTDPEQLTHWGNRIDAHVQLNPGEVVDPGQPLARIRNLGGIPVEDIATTGNGMTIPTARFAHFPALAADDWGLGRVCPFGGQVVVEGNYFVGYYYRVKVRKVTDPPGSFTVLSDSFLVERWDLGFDLQSATGGFFPYLDPTLYFDRRIAQWQSAGSELWEVQLDVATAASEASIFASSPWYRVQLDDVGPAEPPASPVTMDIHITSGAGDCRDVSQGDVITGIFIADDSHFGGWSLSTAPNSVTTPSNQPVVTGLASTDPAAGPAGHAWSLNTATPVAMKPCGYVVRLDVSDRTIVGSMPHVHHQNHIEVGFCLRAK
jgi:hypothetical protein